MNEVLYDWTIRLCLQLGCYMLPPINRLMYLIGLVVALVAALLLIYGKFFERYPNSRKSKSPL